jgi:hypothetical protein
MSTVTVQTKVVGVRVIQLVWMLSVTPSVVNPPCVGYHGLINIFLVV